MRTSRPAVSVLVARRRLLSLALVPVLGAALGLGLGSSPAHAGDGSEAKPFKVGVTAGPHAQILEAVKKYAETQGFKIQIVEFTDYVQPNAALASGDLDANVFQHKPFLDATVRDRGYKLAVAGDAVLMQFGAYSKKVKHLKDLPNGAKVGIPNDPSNGARGLLLLQDQGLIKLKADKGSAVTVLDIVDNPKKLKIVELEAAQLPRSLDDLDAATVNSNYALPAGLVPSRDAIALENPNTPFARIVIAAREQDKNAPTVQKFVKLYRSEPVKQFINTTFKGAYTASW
ncbi:MetQ/NlpA family ABC transporter substrate-binding protein [Oryzomicrobium sp.]|uniref:MetQ/NlpA family ABC transporter substrate-binding protein n=1 Tax=Oryzomicrobium sp. TaxID=1911578 RepID=UPI0025E41CE0|nr:MetQ/NlpA family ABC transporter substrate-binding protein [Oryzomicrobium sp.]MCE1244186.1 MetQ/NlpA family ABC transporter substrate-binding protein [Oryzomicrobium sp.]